MCIRHCPANYKDCGTFCVPNGVSCGLFFGAIGQSCSKFYDQPAPGALTARTASAGQAVGAWANSMVVANSEAYAPVNASGLEAAFATWGNNTAETPGCTTSLDCFCQVRIVAQPAHDQLCDNGVLGIEASHSLSLTHIHTQTHSCLSATMQGVRAGRRFANPFDMAGTTSSFIMCAFGRSAVVQCPPDTAFDEQASVCAPAPAGASGWALSTVAAASSHDQPADGLAPVCTGVDDGTYAMKLNGTYTVREHALAPGEADC